MVVGGGCMKKTFLIVLNAIGLLIFIIIAAIPITSYIQSPDEHIAFFISVGAFIVLIGYILSFVYMAQVKE